MGIDISRLGPEAQKQIATKLGKGGHGKYHNEPITVDGIRFDSRKEAGRYVVLVTLLRAGRIAELKLQPEFTLQEAYKTPEGERVRAIRYRADFSYWRDGEFVVEDVKGVRTDVYKLKRKLMRERLGIEIQEV